MEVILSKEGWEKNAFIYPCIYMYIHSFQVLESLANPNDLSRHEERQQALLELLNAGGLTQFNEEKLLDLAENAQL